MCRVAVGCFVAGARRSIFLAFSVSRNFLVVRVEIPVLVPGSLQRSRLVVCEPDRKCHLIKDYPLAVTTG